MAQENYVVGCSMQRTPLLKADGLCFLKTRFETYIKSKDIDLWQVIQNSDFVFMMEDPEKTMDIETPYEKLKDTEKKQPGKNNEAKMTLYNALLRKEYGRVFMCKTAKEREKVTAIEEAKDLATLHLDELISKLKVYEMILENDGVASKTTKEKVIKEEFEKLESLKLGDDSFAYNTSFEIFREEFNRMSRMDDDLLPMRPWMDNEVWEEPTPVRYHCEPFNYKNGCSEWPTYCWKDDGYCNRGNLLGAYVVGNTLYYQDLEWYEALKDSKLKEEALKNKAIMEGIIDKDDESSNKGWRRWDNFENTSRNRKEREYEMELEDEERYDSEQQMKHVYGDDMKYDPFNVEFTKR
nr:hypothetical protein [Tanacetum cinerariifolium]